jgi:hypothetical protein
MKRIITAHGSHDKPSRETRFSVKPTTTMVWYYDPDDPRSVSLCLKPEYIRKICYPEPGRQIIQPVIKRAGGDYPDLLLTPLEDDLGYPSVILFCDTNEYSPLDFDEKYQSSSGKMKVKTHLSKVVKQIEERNPNQEIEIHICLCAKRFEADESIRIHLLGNSRRNTRKYRKRRSRKHKRVQ